MYDVPMSQSKNAKTDADIATKNTEAIRNTINSAIAVETRSFIRSPPGHDINRHGEANHACEQAEKETCSEERS